jgi:RNA polymerase sigma factor (sigma-70 family)
MDEARRSNYAEIPVDRLIMESFPLERSPYHQTKRDEKYLADLDRLRNKLNWHIDHSLSKRQKEVIKLYLIGKKQREIGKILGIKQQVVSIYKSRAINRLRRALGG